MTSITGAWLAHIAAAMDDTATLLEMALLAPTEDFMRHLKRFYPVTVQLDGEPLHLQLHRLLPVEIAELETEMKRYAPRQNQPPATDDPTVAAWVTSVFTRWVNVEPDQMTCENDLGETLPLTTGAQLLQFYGGRLDLIPQVLALLWGENRVDEPHKGQFRTAALTALQAATEPFVPTATAKAFPPPAAKAARAARQPR